MRDDSKELARVWLRFIENDLLAATALIEELPVIAAFHVQQAIEKSIKAAIALQGVEPPKTHDLKRLYAMTTAVLDWSADEGWLAQVSSWVAVSRYPSDVFGPPPLESEVRHALGQAETLAAEIKVKLA